MRRRILTAGPLAACLLALGGSASAQAAYAPRLSIAFQPATPDSAPAVSSTITQAPGETASKTIRVHYPPQFGFNPAFAVAGCPPSAESSDSCPPESQIGTASAETALGELSGPVYFTSDYRLLIYLRSAVGLLQQKFVEYFQLAPDGGFDAVVDNLPDLSATSSTITLQPGSRSPLLTPSLCGTYPVVGHFTSQNDDQVTSSVSVAISGCRLSPGIDRISVTPPTVQVPGRPGTPVPEVTLQWDLTAAGAGSTVELQRLETRNGFQVRLPLWSRAASALEGPNSLSFPASNNGLPLPAGDYRLVLTVADLRGAPGIVASTTFRVESPAQPGRCQPRRRHSPRLAAREVSSAANAARRETNAEPARAHPTGRRGDCHRRVAAAQGHPAHVPAAAL